MLMIEDIFKHIKDILIGLDMPNFHLIVGTLYNIEFNNIIKQF